MPKKSESVKIFLKNGKTQDEVWEKFTFPYQKEDLQALIDFAKPESLEGFINLAMRVAVKDNMFKHIEYDDMDSDFSITVRLPTTVIEKLGVSPYRKAAKILTLIQLFDKYKNLRWKDWAYKFEIQPELKQEIEKRLEKHKKYDKQGTDDSSKKIISMS